MSGAAPSAVPSLISYNGVLGNSGSQSRAAVAGVTFLLYRDEQGGAPLWIETQNVTPDKTGHYVAQLGATSTNGLPPDLFRNGEPRWLAVQVAGEAEQPRVLLVAVPYAMKAADAATLGGLRAVGVRVGCAAGGDGKRGFHSSSNDSGYGSPANFGQRFGHDRLSSSVDKLERPRQFRAISIRHGKHRQARHQYRHAGCHARRERRDQRPRNPAAAYYQQRHRYDRLQLESAKVHCVFLQQCHCQGGDGRLPVASRTFGQQHEHAFGNPQPVVRSRCSTDRNGSDDQQQWRVHLLRVRPFLARAR